ncbi:MAG: helix-turn-helix domain-containing protein [Oscillospiraceae bacterium]|jgi:transcriptional regulator with XRE-family HTH domain
MYEIFEQLLHQKNVTPYRVSKETGISTATLSDWKKGRSTPKMDKMQKIADYFGVSVDYLLGNTNAKNTSSKDEAFIQDELVGFYGDIKKNLTQDDIEDIKKLMALRAEINRSKKE